MLNANASSQTFNAPGFVWTNDDVILDDLSSIQTILRNLQSKGADGVAGLEHLAKQVSNFVGAPVTTRISSDNQFSLVWTETDPSRYLL